MICPRCDSDTAGLLVKAPVDAVWEVYKCLTCDYTWRSTEPDAVTDPEKYDPGFKIKPAAISELPLMPPVPKLEKM